MLYILEACWTEMVPDIYPVDDTTSNQRPNNNYPWRPEDDDDEPEITFQVSPDGDDVLIESIDIPDIDGVTRVTVRVDNVMYKCFIFYIILIFS